MSQMVEVLSNILMLVMVGTYFYQVRNGSSTPNATTWLVWVVLDLMNAASYFIVVHSNLWKTLYVFIATASAITIFVYAALKGKFGKIGRFDLGLLGLATVGGIIWQTTGDADIANVSLQAVFLISFIPTIHGLLTNNLREKVFPWALSVLAYGLVVIGIVTTDDFRGISLVYPIVNGILGNGSVALIIFLQSKGMLARAHS